MKIRIGHLSTFYHTAILLMAADDTEAKLGAEIEWRLMGTGPAIMQAFEKGELDMAYIGLPPAIIGIAKGIPVLCIAGGHMEGTVMAGKSVWRGFPETGGLEEVLEQFRGRRIGVPGKGSIHDVILREAVERHGFGGSIEIVNYPWADLVTEAIVTDEVSAAVGTPALAAAVRRFAGGRVLYPPEKLWPDNPSSGIIVHRDFLAREEKAVERFLKLHEEATAFMRQYPKAASQLIAGHIGVIDAAFVMDALTISPKYCAQLPDRYIASTMKFVPILRKLGYIQSALSESQIFYLDLIRKIHPESDHYAEGLRSR